MLFALILCAVLIGADQLLKNFAGNALAPAGRMPFIPGVVELRYYENDGAAFSILQGQQLLLIIVTSLALAGALVYVLRFRRPRDGVEYLTFILIFSGGVGNLIDRVALGYVRDYFNLLFMNFAVFNLADMMVVAGSLLLVLAVLRAELRLRRAAAKAGVGCAQRRAAGKTEGGAPLKPGARLPCQNAGASPAEGAANAAAEPKN